ncbi:primosomal protein N' [Acidihalobacter prosperus]
MPSDNPRVIRVAVPLPLRGLFDYLPPVGVDIKNIPAGIRVIVNVGRRRLVGLVCESGVPPHVEVRRLRPALRCLDTRPLIDRHTLALIHFTANYYHHPIGEVMVSALPRFLRDQTEIGIAHREQWRLAVGVDALHQAIARAPRQRDMVAYFHDLDPHRAHDAHVLAEFGRGWRTLLGELVKKELVIREKRPWLEVAPGGDTWPELNAAQSHAVAHIWQAGAADRYAVHLLEGVTGSGKTEVYLHLVDKALQTGRQSLVLVPEIGLTPQLITHFRNRFAVPIATMHSGLGDVDRRNAWLSAASGQALIVIGTRSAIFTPIPRLGLIIVDEEHDASFKQQEGFRYHARDLAVWRGREQNAQVVLGSATPSLETIHHANSGRYKHHRLNYRVGKAKPPRLRLVDVRHKQLDSGLSGTLLAAMGDEIRQGQQVLLFLNRRGYSPVLFCHNCGWLARCPRCDVPMTYHAQAGCLRCHHCDFETALPSQCPECSQEPPKPLGQGTERLESSLQSHFADVGILRIDRDTTRRRGALIKYLGAVRDGQYPILIGTQMLTKGHHFSNVTLVGVIDADQGLYSADYRAHERLAQLLIQVAGRAGRESRQGTVMIQTCQPEHPLLITLLRDGYRAAAEMILKERRDTGMPPYSYLALLRAESLNEAMPMRFLTLAAESLRPLAHPQVDLLGPVIAPMPRRAGRYRSQLLIRAFSREHLHNLLKQGLARLDKLPGARQVRWSVDIDPVDLY